MSGLPFPMLDEVDIGLLEAPFLLEDLKTVMLEGYGDKSLRRYGFNLSFFKAYWDIVKGDLMRAVDEFHRSSRVLKAVTSSFITLAPKVFNPQTLDDFRPIFLVGSVYKIFSKFLADILKLEIHKLISKCQSAFVANRQLLDGVLV